MRKILILAVAFFSFSAAFSQASIFKGKQADEVVKGSNLVRITENSTVPNYVQFREGKQFPLQKLESWLQNYFPNNSDVKLKLIRKETDQLGFEHYRYQQIINGVPVQLGTYLAHVKNGLVVSVNGELTTHAATSNNPSLSEQQALNAALKHVNALKYKWEIAEEEEHIKLEQNNPNATYYPSGDLVYIHKNAKLTNALKLAYKFNIYAAEPFSRSEVYVDANNGEILFTEDKIHHVDAVGTAHTKYSGVQTMTADNNNGTYRLRETGRGNGIRTYNMQTGTNYGSAVDFTDNDNVWNNVNPQQDEVATDAHWGAEMTYDYFSINHSRNSIDGNGFALLSYVHYDNNYANAFWDGQRMTYGDGNGAWTALTALDIAGHEITHGLTTFSANLVYQAESGALNESFSDIFGVTIEWYARPGNANWTMGEDIGSALRSMSNPNAYGDPDTYFGTNWASLTGGDNGGVHTNSGVQNFWYYLMVNGGTGTNDNGDNYTVNAVGMNKAADIAFRNLTVYLTQNSQFSDARFYAIQSAVDLFGGCTPEVETTTNAWYAVGVGPVYVPNTLSDFDAPVLTSCSAPFTVNFNNLSVNGNTYAWDFGDGNTSTQQNPTHTYNNYGTYTVELIADGGVCGIDTTVKLSYVVVDSNIACVVEMPANGTTTTQTSCSGKIYDSGGSNSDYGADEDGVITIIPTGASTVDLSFISFDVEAGQSNCNYDYLEVYDGPNTSASLIGKYCNNSLPPSTISSTGGAITLKFHSDQGVEESGFEIDWQCQMPNQAPNVDFSADIDTTCTGVVNFTDLSTNGPLTWNWNFGDGNTSTQQNPTHTYTANGLYTVQLTAGNGIGTNSNTKTNYIYVDMPPAPATIGDTVCQNSPASLLATGTGVLNWYDAPTAGNLVNTGNTYNTGALSTTTTYYVENVVQSPIQNVGKANNSGGGANYNNYQYLVFDVFKTVEIVSVVVYADGAGTRVVELRDNGGTVLQSSTINMTNGQQRINLNFTVNPGTDYQLGVSNNSTVAMYRNNAGINYPYTLGGLISITKSSANTNPTGYYYFYYDWEVKEPDCISSRTAVVAQVDVCTGLNDLEDGQKFVAYPNPANNQLNVALNNFDGENISLNLLDINGRVIKSIYNSTASNNIKINVDISDVAGGVYNLQLLSNKGMAVKKIMILK